MRKYLVFFLIAIILSMLISCQNDFHQNGGNYGTEDETDTSTDLNVDTESNQGTNTDTSASNTTDSDVNGDSTDTAASTNTDTSIDSNTNTNTDTNTDTETDTSTDEPEPDSGNTEEPSTPQNPTPNITIKGENGLVYNLKADDTLKVVSYEGALGHISIPRSCNSYIVTEIGENAFSGYGEKIANVQLDIGFVTLMIPDTVTKIGKGAFNDCVDVKVQFSSTDATLSRDEWLENLVVEYDEDHDETNPKCPCSACQAIDTIKFIRPAIGWHPFKKP